MNNGGEIQVGNKFGDWSITQYKPIVYEEIGGTRDGLIKLVNQDTFDEILVQYDGALRNPKWFARIKGVQFEGKSPKEVIEKLKYANGGKTEEVYIEFLNKEKGYKEDVKHFNSYEEAVEWARKNFDKFDSDMIKYKYADGGGVDVVKKDRYGNEVKIGDAIHIRVLTGKYGQTKDYEGIVTNFDKFGNVELDGQRSVRYTADYKHNDYEHGHHIWVEKINAKDIKENLRVPKKFTPTFSSRDKVYGEDVIFTGTEIELKEFLKNKYPNSVWGQWNPLFNKGWRYNNGKYISPDKQEYDAFDFYQSVEQGQGYLNMLMIPKNYADGGGIEIAEMPTRERTTITKPTTTPTTTPSKPDKDSPYKPKHIPKPKARK